MMEIPPLHWRCARLADARLLSHLGGATYLATAALDHDGDALLDFLDDSHGVGLYRAWLENPAYLFVIGVTPRDAPAGFAMLAPHDEAPSDREIKRFYLLPPWHGTGEADRLMATLLHLAGSRQIDRLFLSVFETNARARSFYERHRFTLIGDTDSWLAPDRKLSLYSRRLGA